MTEMVWDEVGARYYETGVSKGIFFPIDGSVGVPWNGLVSVGLTPQNGTVESYYFDGIKYMDRVLAEDFQATIQAITTPDGFEACMGDREYKPGVMTSFNKRDKFHMAWRTEIGSDAGENVAYKIHISYNNLVQPVSKEYQTVADSTQIAPRSYVTTATPACGRHSYFWFDSRKHDLTALEAQLALGILPKCWELKTLIDAPDLSDDDCRNLLEDLESYVHGQVVDDDKTVPTDTETFIYGLINNGLDITELPAVGAFAANDSAASEVGTGDILADDDDATYITSADGDLGYTVGLPPLVGYVEGSALELHIRMSISGDVNPDDPDNVDADAQVHISTDADGDLTIGGFSDGTDEGMGFALAVVDGTPVDYVVPLSMDAWVDSTLDDVVTALESGAYLNVVGATNNNTDTTPEVRVYEASIVMLNDTDTSKFLRIITPDDYCFIEQHVYDPGTFDDMIASNTVSIDFKIVKRTLDLDFDGFLQTIINWPIVGDPPGTLQMELSGTTPKLTWYEKGSPLTAASHSWTVKYDKWYTATVDWTWASIKMKFYDRDSGKLIGDYDRDAGSGHSIDAGRDPIAMSKHFAGSVGNTGATYEVFIHNAQMQVHCNDLKEWTRLDLSTALFLHGSPTDLGPYGEYDSVAKELVDNAQGHPSFYFDGFVLDPTKTYEFRAKYSVTGHQFGIMQENPSYASTFYSDNFELGFTLPTATEMTLTVGPGIDDWDAAITAGYQTLIRFDTSPHLTSLSYKEV